jgi:D-beta-D-heptose 7-phosphate kinase/D-beta-D-heptose 1-phosphate adenosyltransferase
VDLVVVFDEDTPIQVIQKVQPDVLVKGGDYQPEKIVGYDFVRSYGGKVVTVPLVSGRSTSALIAAMKGDSPSRP